MYKQRAIQKLLGNLKEHLQLTILAQCGGAQPQSVFSCLIVIMISFNLFQRGVTMMMARRRVTIMREELHAELKYGLY